MPYQDKTKQKQAIKEAMKRLRSQRKANGLCQACGQPLNRTTTAKIPATQPKHEYLSVNDYVTCPGCRQVVPRAETDLRGYCFKCKDKR